MRTRPEPNILTISQAADLSGCNRHVFSQWLTENPTLRAAVVCNLPGERIRISRPRLLRYLHGDAADLVSQREAQ